MNIFLTLLLALILNSCEQSDLTGLDDPKFPISSKKIPNLYLKITDIQRYEIEKSRSLDNWYAVEHLDSAGWQYSEIRNQGHKVREDLKLSYKWRSNKGARNETKVNLSGQSRDITLLRYPLSTFLFQRAGFIMPKLKFKNLFINNVWQGPYLNLELINGEFLKLNSMPEGALFKAQYRAELTLTNNVKMSQAFVQKYPDPVEADLKSLIHLEKFAEILDLGIVKDTLELSKVLDIDNAIRYLAVSKLIQNNDGIRNNYYLYLNSMSNKFEFIPWDLDETFQSANVFQIYQNNLFEQLELRSDFKKRIFQKMHEVWDEGLILQELTQLNDSLGVYAKAQGDYFLNSQESHQNELNSIVIFIKNVTSELTKLHSFAKK
jgi:spore coat protein H